MEAREFLNVLHLAGRLKENTRHCWFKSGRRESVAEHCWRLTIMAYFLGDEFPGADMNRVIRMCIFHDMGEAFTGDIPTFEKSGEDERREEEILHTWVKELPEPYCTDLSVLYREMEEQVTTEARIYKALDKLEALISHNEADISTWLPLEYDLNLTYGKEQTEFSEYLKKLRREIKQDTLDKIEEEKQNKK